MRVVVFSSDLEEKYRSFLFRHPRSLIYASPEFRDFLVRAVGGDSTLLLALDGQDQIVGALGYFRYEAHGIGTVINSLPWYGSHGGCVVAGVHADEARKSLLACYRQASESPNVLSATLILSPDENAFLDQYRKVLAPAVEDRRIGQLTALPADGDALEARLELVFHQKTRNLVRKSLKQRFVLQLCDDEMGWCFLFETHLENMLAIGGKPKRWEHFVALRESLPAGSRRILVAEFEGKPVAALLLLYFNRTVEYVTPVIKQDYRAMQPLSFLIWHGMLDAVRAGYFWWNWGGTWVSQTSLHHFKAGWGAVDQPYTYLINSSDKGRSTLAVNREALGDLFPYYYTYPYDKLC